MEMRKFNIGGKEVIFCNTYRNTRGGFAHDTTMFVNGIQWGEATCHYINRTWERYYFQTVMQRAVEELLDREYETNLKAFKTARGYNKMTVARKTEFSEVYEELEEVKFLKSVYEALK